MYCSLRYKSVITMANTLGRWICAFSIAGGLISCNPWSANSQQDTASRPLINLARNNDASVVAIANLADLAEGSTITIQGTVANTAPFLNGGAYEITDSTGSIWVITNGQPPSSGTQIQVAGEVQFHDLQLGGNNFGEIFITETQTQAPNPNVQSLENSDPKPQKLSLESYLLPHKENHK